MIPMDRLRMSVSSVKDCRRKASSKGREAPLISQDQCFSDSLKCFNNHITGRFSSQYINNSPFQEQYLKVQKEMEFTRWNGNSLWSSEGGAELTPLPPVPTQKNTLFNFSMKSLAAYCSSVSYGFLNAIRGIGCCQQNTMLVEAEKPTRPKYPLLELLTVAG